MKNFNLKDRLFSSSSGILAIIFGIIALAFPSITIFSLVIYFAITILIGGIILLVGSIRSKKINHNWQILLLEGLIGILFGIIILSQPQLAAVVFITLIGVWSLVIGTIFTIIYFKHNIPKKIRNIYLPVGLLSILFGLLIVVNPFEGPRMVIVLIGLYAIIYGVFSITNKSKNYSYYARYSE